MQTPSHMQTPSQIQTPIADTNFTCPIRVIFILHLVNNPSEILSIQNTDCSIRDFAVYDVKYKAIIKDDSFRNYFETYLQELSIQLTQTVSDCTALLIATEVPETDEIFRTTIIDFLPVEIQNTTIYNFSPIMLQSLSPVKVRNIVYNNPFLFKIQRESETVLSAPTRFKSERNPYIDCVWWFKYYNNVFNCAKGRYRQLSGTCYLNSIINGFILSDYSRKVVMTTLKNSDHKTRELAKKPIEINPGVCYNPEYFFRLFYNAVCRPENFSDLKFIWGIGGSEANLIEKYAFNYHTGLAGAPADALEKIFNIIYHGEKVLKADSIDNHNSIPFAYDTIPRFFKKGIGFPQVQPLVSKDNQVIFDPDFCVIGVTVSEEAAKIKGISISGHAMVGYRCNGVCKVYDSNNYFYDFDWENIYEENITNFLTTVSEIYKKPYDIFSVRCVVYIKRDMKAELDQRSLQELCSF